MVSDPLFHCNFNAGELEPSCIFRSRWTESREESIFSSASSSLLEERSTMQMDLSFSGGVEFIFFLYFITRQNSAAKRIPRPANINPGVVVVSGDALKTNSCRMPFAKRIKASRPATNRKVVVHWAGFLLMYNLFSFS